MQHLVGPMADMGRDGWSSAASVTSPTSSVTPATKQSMLATSSDETPVATASHQRRHRHFQNNEAGVG